MSIADELYEASNAKREAKLKAEKGKNEGAVKGVEAFLGKALQTLTGGLSDYAEVGRRNYLPGYERSDYTVDEIRKEADKLYKDRSGLALGGDVLGNVLQFGGVGKGIRLASQAAQAIPKLAAGGKAVQTAMNAPGIVGAAQSGGMQGIGTGLLKEGTHQLDRLGSDKTAAEDFNPLGSAARILGEGALGMAGGLAGGAISNMTGKGQIAKLGREAIPEADIAAIRAAQAPVAGMGIGPTAAEGKLAGHEALRYAGNPKYTKLASDLEGLTEFAGKNSTAGRLADEMAGSAARNAPTTTSFSGLRKEAGTRLGSAETAVSHMGSKQLDPPAYWAVQGDPALAALRDRALREARIQAQADLQSGGLSKTKAAAQAAKDNPSDVVEALTRALPRGTAPEQQGIRNALEIQSPFFKTLHEAQRTAGDYTKLHRSLGRQHATGQPDPSPTFGASLFGGPATWAKDALILGKRAAEGSAMRKAGQMNLDEEIAELLKLVGRRRPGQKVTQATLAPVLQTLSGNVLD